MLVFALLFAVQLLFYSMAAYSAGEMPLLAERCFLPTCYQGSGEQISLPGPGKSRNISSLFSVIIA